MARIYAPHSFKASSVNANFYRYLESLDDQAVVLLEFVSQGSNHRQVDCAILSSGGVDLLEVKDKRGRIEGYAAQPWTVIDARGHRNEIVNKKGGQRENPFEQAANTAQDFERYLSTILGRPKLPVYPLVVIPEPHPESRFEQHNQTYVANGVEEIGKKLRAYQKRYERRGLTSSEIQKVIQHLALSQVGLALLEGRVVDRETGRGVPGVEVRFTGDHLAEGLSVLTDDQGSYQATLPVGDVQIRLVPPKPFEERTFNYQAHQGQNQVQEVDLIATAPMQTVDGVSQIAGLIQALQGDAAKASEQTIRQIMELLHKERQEREALYELLLEQSAQPRQPASGEGEAQKLYAELREIRELLSRLGKSQTAHEREVVLEQVQQLLPSLAVRASSPPRSEPPPTPIKVIEARPVPPARKERRGLPIGIVAISAVLALAAGGWYLQSQKPAAPAKAPITAPSKPTTSPKTAGSGDVKPTTGTTTRATGQTATATSQQTRPSNPQSPDPSKSQGAARAAQPTQSQPPVRTITPVNTPAPKPAGTPTPRPTTVAAPKPATTSTPSPASPQTDRRPVATREAPSSPEPLPGVPVQAKPKQVAMPEPEALPGTPVRAEPPKQPNAEELPGDPLPGQPLSLARGVPPTGGTCPDSHPVKGNISSGRLIYHLPGQEFYEQTRPEACFASAGEAAQAGYRPSRR